MRKRVFAIIKKEFRHIFRDTRSLLLAFLMPVMMIFLYGHAIKIDIKNINIGINDPDRSSASRELIANFSRSGYFTIVAYPNTTDEIEDLFLKRKIKAAIVFPQDFLSSISINQRTQVQVLIDGSDANTATIVMNYVEIILASYSQGLNNSAMRAPILIEPRVWYNPDLESGHFIVPGLVAVILMMICALMTSVTIAREKETGTMEQLLVSPIRPVEIIFGKVFPYIIIAFLDGAVVVAAAKLMFNVAIQGSLLMLVLLSIFYLYASLAIGVFISTRVKTQQVAMMGSLIITILPSLILSGFVFPIRSMPVVLKVLSYVVPAKYYINIIRGIILKGIGATYLWPNTIFLFALGTLLLMVSVARFKTSLD
ncbi:MAG: ABC transporter permease [Candidatus Zhuqueibacterota bacterium]